ncbi:MAG TPA: aromatic-ring-hydroxylating dioxygenase subunit beta [Phenylobacterium sp.]|uniref:aromatic-ring-hydroxylating dioxygenase subunit beta n=1 Tax=Phenylobacterium sp. TaxID=1871053 RepID=UPI002B4A8DEF|nr:aromatic-ring-hydroxylating dioxygenase subunit beta [Phenylobacterium sp.]HKR88253.1 aromatic-ring-hydroxylating dioxygenase subunit beta [Phenylobacterium sp.]
MGDSVGALERHLDRLAVEDFYAAYVACLDEDRLEAWPDFFLEDGLYGLWSKENWDAGLPAPMFLCRNRRQMHDRVTSFREANLYPTHWNRHLVSSVQVIAADVTEISARSNYAVLQTRLSGETFIYQSGRAHDVFHRGPQGLQLKERRLVYDTLAVQTLFVMPI